MTRVLGCDLSLNHGGFVLLEDGELSRFWYYTDKVGSASKHEDAICFRASDYPNDKNFRSVVRMGKLEAVFRTVFECAAPDYAGIEDYAVRAEQGAHFLGEVGGLARLTLFKMGIPFRLHDPISVKMFATHDGTARGKTLVEKSVAERWGATFFKFNQPKPKPKKTPKKPPKQNRQTSEDLADAFAIAKLVELEVQLRAGEVELRNLHAKEIQVFNRCTKTYPRSLLDREWIAHSNAKTFREDWEGYDDASFPLRDLDFEG